MKRGLLRIAPGMNNGSTGTTVPYWLLSPSPATNVAAPAENQNPTEENQKLAEENQNPTEENTNIKSILEFNNF
jgi:hypothetical protein